MIKTAKISFLPLAACMAIALLASMCSDYSKTLTTCTVTSVIIVKNVDRSEKYFFHLKDTTGFVAASNENDEVVLTSWTIDMESASDTLDTLDENDSTDTRIITRKLSWKAEHFSPWDSSICAKSNEPIAYMIELYDVDTILRSVISGTDTIDQVRDTTIFLESQIYEFDCSTCAGTFTGDSQDSTQSNDSMYVQSEQYMCYDTITFNDHKIVRRE